MNPRWTWIQLSARWTVTRLHACLSLLQGWYLRWVKDSVATNATATWNATKRVDDLNATRWTDYVEPEYWTPEAYAWPGLRAQDAVGVTPAPAFSDSAMLEANLAAHPRVPFPGGVPSRYVVLGYWTPDDYTQTGIRDDVTATLTPA